MIYYFRKPTMVNGKWVQGLVDWSSNRNWISLGGMGDKYGINGDKF